MKIQFGVMSSKYEMDCDDLDSAKVAMILFIESNVPIAIYSPEELKTVFLPKDFLTKPGIGIPEKIRSAYKSIITLL
jgi:hypothetical protein